jgi:hypothetical protein
MSTEEAQQNTTTAAATATAAPGQEAYEEEHVHSVYEQIAEHFSATRYKVGGFQCFVVFSCHLSNTAGKHLQSFLREELKKSIKPHTQKHKNPFLINPSSSSLSFNPSLHSIQLQ